MKGTVLEQPHLLVLGLGNPIVRDDAVAFHVIAQLRQLWDLESLEGVVVRERCIGGLDLLFETEGFDALLLVDAYHARGGVAGSVRILDDTEMGDANLDWVEDHWLNLPTALKLGRRLGWTMPSDVRAVVVDIGDEGLVFGEELSPAVDAAVPTAVAAVADLLPRFGVTLGPPANHEPMEASE